tara:strand:+ start:2686 stop:3129 length:444 start_codon:yes stop_codon:yes gene_type:complete
MTGIFGYATSWMRKMFFALKRTVPLVVALILSACGNSNKRAEIDDSLICKGAIAVLNNKNPHELFSHFLDKWNYYSIIYVRESDGKSFNYYCRPRNGRILIKSTLDGNDAHSNRLYYQIKDSKLLIKQNAQADDHNVKKFRLSELRE